MIAKPPLDVSRGQANICIPFQCLGLGFSCSAYGSMVRTCRGGRCIIEQAVEKRGSRDSQHITLRGALHGPPVEKEMPGIARWILVWRAYRTESSCTVLCPLEQFAAAMFRGIEVGLRLGLRRVAGVRYGKGSLNKEVEQQCEMTLQCSVGLARPLHHTSTPP